MPTSTSEIIQPTGIVTYTGTGQTKPGDIPVGVQPETPISGTYTPFPVKPISTPIVTSNIAQQEATQLQTDIQKAQTAPPIVPESAYDATALKTAYQPDIYTQRKEQLAQRRTASQQAIEADFAKRQREVEGAQAKATGQQAKTISRLSGWLGPTGSGEMAMQNLELRNRQEITDLLAAKQMALLKAQQSYEDQDFATAKEELSNAKKLEQTIYDRSRQFTADKTAQRESQAKAQQAEQKSQQAAVTFALKQGINKPYYSIDGVNIVDTRTGELVDPTQVDPNAEVQIVKKQPEPSDFMVVDLADGKYLMNKLTGEKQFIGELEADIKQVSVDNRVKLVNMKTGETVADLGAVSRASSGGGGSAKIGTTGMTSSQTQQAEIKIETEAKKLERELEEGKTTWAKAWNYMYDTYSSYLEAAYPDEDINAMIDEMLGGTEFRDSLQEKEEESSKTWWNPFD